jgi:hypothetical protein
VVGSVPFMRRSCFGRVFDVRNFRVELDPFPLERLAKELGFYLDAGRGKILLSSEPTIIL